VAVRAVLDGYESDLRTLVDLFPEGDPRVVNDEDDGQYYLESSELDAHFTDGGRMLEVAERTLVRLFAIARLQPAEFRDVSLTGRFDRPNTRAGADTSAHSNDTWGWREQATVVRAGTAEARAQVRATAEARAQVRATAAATHTGGTSVELAQARGLRYLRLAQAHPEVDELLQLLGTSDLSWKDLYKAYEIVNNATGRGKKTRWALEPLGYSKAEVRDFTASVNLHRHARPSGRPQRELSLAECQQFVRDLTERWLRWLESVDR
jgi:hypothetical protein